MKRYFCTCFDHVYLIYGLTLFESLKKTGIDFQLFVLCLDDQVYQELSGLSQQITPVSVKELEEFDQELLKCKETRNTAEYIFTMSPCLPLYLLWKYSEADLLCYVDSDLFFFSSPEILFRELGKKSLFITEHRYSNHAEKKSRLYGKYNMAFQIYRNNDVGIRCLRHWRKQCLEWCFDRPENGKFADQKYLEDWPEIWSDETVISSYKGANLALWNLKSSNVKINKNMITVDDGPCIFVHYQGFKILTKHIALWSHENDQDHLPTICRQLAHFYMQALNATMKKYPLFFTEKFLIPQRFMEKKLVFTRMEKFFAFLPHGQFQFLLRLCYFYLWNHRSFFWKI